MHCLLVVAVVGSRLCVPQLLGLSADLVSYEHSQSWACRAATAVAILISQCRHRTHAAVTRLLALRALSKTSAVSCQLAAALLLSPNASIPAMMANSRAAGDGLLGAPVAIAGAVWFSFLRLKACKAAAPPYAPVERHYATGERPHATGEQRQRSPADWDSTRLPPLRRGAARPNGKAAGTWPTSLGLGRVSLPRLGAAEQSPLQRKKSCDVPVMLHHIAVEEAAQQGMPARARSVSDMLTVDTGSGEVG
jgi:hypothetical protein